MPDAVVRQAQQIELVDMTPEALRRRLAHGNVYAPDKIDAALGNYFRVGNLTALRELALLWLADKVDEQLDRYRADHGIGDTWETRERVVVALTGGPEGDTLIRRAARVAARTKGADLLALHVARGDGLTGGDPKHLADQRALVEDLGGTYHQVIGTDVPEALLEFARGVNATQLVLGASRRGRLAQLFSPGVGVTTAAESGSIDVHLVTHEEVAQLRRRPDGARSALSRGRRIAGFALAALGLPLLTVLLLAVGDAISLPTEILAFLVTVIAVALLGGLPLPCSPPCSASCCSTTGSRRRSTDSPSRSGRTCSPCWRSFSSPPRSAPSSTSPPAAPGKPPAPAPRPPPCSPSPAACSAGPDRCRPCWSRSARPSTSTASRLLERTDQPDHGPDVEHDDRAAGASSTAPADPPAGRRRKATRRSTSTTPSRSSCAATPSTRPTGASSKLSPPRPPSPSARSGSPPPPRPSVPSPR